jgi:hypothetical protein
MHGQSRPLGFHQLDEGFLRPALGFPCHVGDPSRHGLAEFFQDLFDRLGAAVSVRLADVNAHRLSNLDLLPWLGGFKLWLELVVSKTGFFLHQFFVQNLQGFFTSADTVNRFFTVGALDTPRAAQWEPLRFRQAWITVSLWLR